MNKKIKKLAKKAGLSHAPSTVPDMCDLYDGADFELEKFAELIVKECIKAVKEEGKTYAIKEAGEAQSEWFADAIRKHFGIK